MFDNFSFFRNKTIDEKAAAAKNAYKRRPSRIRIASVAVALALCIGCMPEVIGDGFPAIFEASAEEKDYNGLKYERYSGSLWITGYSGNETDVVIPSEIDGDDVVGIYREAFMNNTAVKSVIIPEGVTTLEHDIFNGCTGLEKVVIPESVREIGNAAFKNCEKLADIFFPEGITAISDYMFMGCSGLKKLTIPDSVKTIGYGAFSSAGVKNLVIPEGVLTISSEAFYNGKMETVTVPKTVTSIGLNAFYGNNNMETLYFGGTASEYIKLHIGTSSGTEVICLGETPHEHEYEEGYTITDEKHWKKCFICGYKNEVDKHTASEWITDIQADENTEGSRHKECTACGLVIETEIVEKHAHTYDTDKFITDIDNHWSLCTICGLSSAKEKHTLGGYENDNKSHWKVCIGCFEKIGEAEHIPSDMNVDDDYHWQTCIECHAEILKEKHVPSQWIIEGEKHWKVCSGCEQKYAEGEHDFDGEYVSDNSDHWKECSICKAKSEKEAHTPKTYLEYDETKHWYECTECGGKVNAVSHINSDWIVDKEATLEEKGSRHKECTVCGGTTVTEEIPKPEPEHEHNFSKDYSNDKTYHWFTCAGCTEQKDKEKHTPSDWIVDEEASLVEKGRRHKECIKCGYVTVSEDIPKLDCVHIPGEFYVFDKTNHWYECTQCGEKVGSVKHTPSDWIIDEPATETKDGHKYKECTFCKYVIEEEAIKYEDTVHKHTYSGEWQIDTESHWRLCDECGEKSAPEKHVMGEGVLNDVENGDFKIMSYRCKICNDLMKTEIVENTDKHTHTSDNIYQSDITGHWCGCTGCKEKVGFEAHTENNGVVVTEPTETTDGEKQYSCKLCGYLMRTETIPSKYNGTVDVSVNSPYGIKFEVPDKTAVIEAVFGDNYKSLYAKDNIGVFVTIKDGSAVSEMDKANASAILSSDRYIGVFYDITVEMKINDTIQPVHETLKPIVFKLSVPQNFIVKDRDYSIVRVHSGRAENINGYFNPSDNMITFASDRFSTYALVYHDPYLNIYDSPFYDDDFTVGIAPDNSEREDEEPDDDDIVYEDEDPDDDDDENEEEPDGNNDSQDEDISDDEEPEVSEDDDILNDDDDEEYDEAEPNEDEEPINPDATEDEKPENSEDDNVSLPDVELTPDDDDLIYESGSEDEIHSGEKNPGTGFGVGVLFVGAGLSVAVYLSGNSKKKRR